MSQMEQEMQKACEECSFQIRESKKDLKEALGISKRTANALFGGHIYTLDDLKKVTQEDILDCRNIGPIQLTEVVTKAKERGIDIPEGDGLKYKLEWYKKTGYKEFLEGMAVTEKPKPATNEDLFRIFCDKYPEMHVSDYSPLDQAFTKGRCGITIFIDNGDTLLYFPEVKNED